MCLTAYTFLYLSLQENFHCHECSGLRFLDSILVHHQYWILTEIFIGYPVVTLHCGKHLAYICKNSPFTQSSSSLMGWMLG